MARGTGKHIQFSIDNHRIHSEWGHEMDSISMGGGGLQIIIEKHCYIARTLYYKTTETT